MAAVIVGGADGCGDIVGSRRQQCCCISPYHTDAMALLWRACILCPSECDAAHHVVADGISPFHFSGSRLTSAQGG